MNSNIGQQLQQARKARNSTLEDISRATHMRAHYLQALEEGDYESLPSITQARGFLRAYANYLGLNADALLAEMNGEIVAEADPIADEEKRAEISPESGQSDESANAIFIEVGERLKTQREMLGLSLEDIEHHTNLRMYYIQALEQGDLDDLPSPVQGRGMLNNYAVFLGMDPDPVLIRFAEGLQARLATRQETAAESQPKSMRRKTVPRPVRRLLSNDFLIGGSLIAFLAIFVVWGAIRIFAMQSDESPAPTAPSIADVLLASSTPSPTTLPPTETATRQAAAFPNPTGTPQANATEELPLIISDQEGIEIYLTIHQRTWVRITVDGETVLDGRVLAGSAYSYSGESQIEILTGNGEAIQVFYNQKNLERMGGYGKVVNWIFTREGILTPTPTITPTPSATPRVTPTAPLLPDAGTVVPAP